MLFYVIWFLGRCICRKNQPIGGCLRRGLVFVAYPHPRWGYPPRTRAPAYSRWGGVLHTQIQAKAREGRQPETNRGGLISRLTRQQSIDNATFFVRCRKFCRKNARLRQRTGANATARTGDTRRAHTSARAYTRAALIAKYRDNFRLRLS